MSKIINKAKDLACTVKEKYDSAMTKIAVAFMSGQCAVMSAMPVYAAEAGGKVTINKSLNLETAVGGLLGIVMQIAFYVGIALVVFAAFNWIMAYQSDDSERQSKHVKLLVVGAALIGFRALLTTAGIISG